MATRAGLEAQPCCGLDTIKGNSQKEGTSAVLGMGEMRKAEDHLFTVNREPLWLILETAITPLMI